MVFRITSQVTIQRSRRTNKMDHIAAILEAERIKLLDEVFARMSLSLDVESRSTAAGVINDMKARVPSPLVAFLAAPAPEEPQKVNKDGKPASAYRVFQRVVKTMFNTSTLKDVKATMTGAWVREDYERFDKANRPAFESEFPGLCGSVALEDALMTRFVTDMVSNHSATTM